MGQRKEWREDIVMKEKNEYKLNSGTKKKKRKKKRKRNKREEWIKIKQLDEGKIETCEEII